MIRPLALPLALALTLAVPAGGFAPATAQPLMLPGARLPDEAGAPAEPGLSGAPGAAPPAQPAATRPVLPKNPAEESILNRDLRLNGGMGSLRVERAGKTELRARIAIEGTRPSRPGEVCTVKPEAPVPLAPRGRVDGLARYEIGVPGCAVSADLLDGALWVRGAEICTVEAADCRIDPRGLWGPEPAQLAAQARAIEGDRGQADRAVRENYKALSQRARPQDVRAVVTEQAAFSSEREMACRSYARESAHGFCNARFTEARAAQLAARLGLNTAAPAPRRQPAATPPRPLPPTPE